MMRENSIVCVARLLYTIKINGVVDFGRVVTPDERSGARTEFFRLRPPDAAKLCL